MNLPSKLCRLGLLGAIFISLGLLQGCLISPPPKVTFGRDQQLKPGDWTVDGIAINDTHSQVNELLGTPTYISPNFSSPGKLKEGYTNGEETFGERGPHVTYNSNGQVIEVVGRTLMHNGQVIIVATDPEGSIEYALGKGFRVGHTVPKTDGGIFPTGHVFNYATHKFQSDDANFEIWINREKNIGSITSSPLDND